MTSLSSSCRWISITRNLAIGAALGLVLCALAMQDIAHGEADLRNEWWAVRIGFTLIALFIASTLVTLNKIQRIVQHNDALLTKGQ